MKRVFALIAIAAVALLTECARVEDLSTSEEIRFQTVNYATKAVSYANGPFTVSAWYKGTSPEEDADFMDRIRVNGTNGSSSSWMPEVTYYWPKTGTINFLAFSPYDVAPSTFTETAIAYTNITVGNKDIMYSDLATGCTAANSSAGVPLLFHHLLAKLGVRIKAAYNDIYDETTGTYTHWDVTLSGTFEIKNIATQGSITLTPVGTGWKTPASKVWTPTTGSATTTYKVPVPTESITAPGYTPSLLTPTADSPVYIMPQAANGKEVAFTLTIKTYRANGADEAAAKAACDAKIAAGTPDIVESDVPITATIGRTGYESDKWTINSATVYTLSISPAYNGKIQVPVYYKDLDGDGIPDDADNDGILDVTVNPGKALKDSNGNPVPAVLPVYIKDADGDGVADDENGDGIPDTTTDVTKALKVSDPSNPGSKIPVYVKDENGDGIPETENLTTTDPAKSLQVTDPDDPSATVPVYIKDADGDGVADDENGDGIPDTTLNPSEALKVTDPSKPSSKIPVYLKDEDGNGAPDKAPVTTTDPSKALKKQEYIEEEANGPVKITFDPAVMSWDSIQAEAVEEQ